MTEITATPAGISMGIDIDAPTQLTQSTTITGTGTSTEGTQPTKSFLESVPEAYRQKEWVANLSKTEDPWSEIFKAHENALSMIGRKAEGLRVPGDNATEDDWKAFYRNIGVPETADKYEYKPPEAPEHLKPYVQQDEALMAAMKEAALKAGLRPEGFKHLTEAFDKYYLAELDKTVQGVNTTMAKLENDFKTKFGDRSNQVLEGWQKSISGLLGEQQAAVMQALDPSVKVVLAEHFEAFAKKYIREDNLNLDVPAYGHQMSPTEYGDAYASLYAKVRSSRPGTPEHIQAKQQMDALRAKGTEVFKT